MNLRHLLVIVGITAISIANSPSFADIVSVSPTPRPQSDSAWVARPVEILRGEIVAFDHQKCEIQFDSGQRQTIASHRVITAVPTTILPDHQTWIDAYRQRDDAAMIASLTGALATRPPVWRQQWLTAVTADACFRMGRDAVAYDLVRQIDSRPMPPMTVAVAGVHWRVERITQTSSELALDHLDDASPLVRWVAASRLLSGKHRDTAKQALGDLSRLRARPTVMVGARLMLAASANPAELATRSSDLQNQIERLPIAIQDGPRSMLIDRFTRAGLDDAAREISLTQAYAPSVLGD